MMLACFLLAVFLYPLVSSGHVFSVIVVVDVAVTDVDDCVVVVVEMVFDVDVTVFEVEVSVAEVSVVEVVVVEHSYNRVYTSYSEAGAKPGDESNR